MPGESSGGDRGTGAPGAAESLGSLLGGAGALVRGAVAEALGALGVSPREFGALGTIAQMGPLSQRALGAARCIDRTTLVALIDALEERGLVARAVDPQDRRAYAVTLTRRGEQVLDRARTADTVVEARLLAPVAPADRVVFARALRAHVRGTPPTQSSGEA